LFNRRPPTDEFSWDDPVDGVNSDEWFTVWSTQVANGDTVAIQVRSKHRKIRCARRNALRRSEHSTRCRRTS
jgi:hypothetical protein